MRLITAGRGKVILKAEPIANTRDKLRVQFRAARLSNKEGFFSKSDPFLTASRLREDNTWVRVWQSETVNNSLNPTWGVAEIPTQRLCNGDLYRPIRFEIFDWESDGQHKPMGEFQTTVQQLVEDPAREYDVIEPAKKSKKSYKNSGVVNTRIVELVHCPLFVDYLKGGCELSLMVAIDFTGSNGPPTDPSSLHYIDSTGRTLNEYQQAINTVGRVLEEYDTDKLFPVYGFGARVNGMVSHCFTVFPEGVVSSTCFPLIPFLPRILTQTCSACLPIIRKCKAWTASCTRTTSA